MARLTPLNYVIRRLFALSGNRCAFPECDHLLVTKKGKFIGQVCHIEGVKGERFNPNQTDEERRSFENLVLMCYEHHIITDDEVEFTVEKMREIKETHECQFTESPFLVPKEFEADIYRDVRDKLDALFSVTLRIEDKVDKIYSLLTLTKPSEEIDKFHVDQLKSIQELKKQHKYNTVIELLTDFKSKNWDHINDELKFKVIVSLGYTYIDLLKKEEAARVLNELKDIQLENEEKFALLTIAGAFSKDKESFNTNFEKTISYNPKNVNAWVAYLFINGTNPNFAEEEIPSEIRNLPEVVFNLGETYIERGERSKGIEYFYKYLSMKDGSSEQIADSKAMIGTRLILGLQDPFKFIHKQYSLDEKRDISQAIILLSEAWEVLRHTEIARQRYFVVMHRGVAYKLTGQIELATLDMQTAYDLSGSIIACKNLIVIYLEQNRLKLAEIILLSWDKKTDLTDEERYSVSTMKARLFLLLGRTMESISELEKNLKDPPFAANRETLSMIVSFLMDKSMFKESLPFSTRLKNEYPDEIVGYVLEGAIHCGLKNLEEGKKNFEKAYHLVGKNTQPFEIYELASQLAGVEDFEKAADLFNRIADVNISNALSRGLIYAYFQSGNLSAALTLAENLLENNPDSPFLAEIVITICMEVGYYDKASQTAMRFLTLAPLEAKDLFLLKTAAIFFAKREPERVPEFLNQIKEPLRFSMEDAFKVAKLYLNVGEVTKGEKLAYEIRNKFYEEREAHETFIALSVKFQGDKEASFPEMITKDCAVYLLDDAEKENVYFISEESIPDPVLQLQPDDQLTLTMLGKKVGEEIVVNKRYGVVEKYVVAIILSKNVLALRQSMHLLDTKYSEHTQFSVFKMPEGNIEELTDMMRKLTLEKKEFEDRAIDLYRQGIAPIGVLASILKRNVVEQWFHMISSADVFVVCYSHNEQAEVFESVASGNPLVLDLTTLLTTFFIYSSQDFLLHSANELWVAKSTIEELRVFSDELGSFGEEGRMSVGFQNGKIFRSVISHDIIQKQKERIIEIIEWCQKNTHIKSPSNLLEVKREARVKYSSLLTASFYETILMAQESGGLIVSDDDIFKKFLQAEYGLRSFSTFQWLVYLFSRNLIDSSMMEDYSTQLIMANHVFIPPAGNILWKTFDMAGFMIQKPFTTALRGLIVVHPVLITGHIVRFVKELFLNGGLATTRNHTILYLLTELSKHEKFEDIKNILRLRIPVEFNLLPTYGKDFLQLIGSF